MQKAFYAILLGLGCSGLLSLTPDSAWAQGSIYGTVERSDQSIPSDGEISFIGFLAGTDDELRVSGSIGAGYESGFWFDNFQNYLSVASGESFTYRFFDTLAGESYRLESTIEPGGLQQEDILLSPSSWPWPPDSVRVARDIEGQVHLYWAVNAGVTVHLYRRVIPSEGSFFRIDDPSGIIVGTGVTGGSFSDTTTEYHTGYTYLLLAVDESGIFSPPAVIKTHPADCCGYYTDGYPGNTGGEPDGKRNLADVTRLIDRAYLSKRLLWCDLNGDTNSPFDRKINLADITRIIDLIFLSKTELDPCE